MTVIMTDELRSGKTFWLYLNNDYSGKLSRYETSLRRQFSALLQEQRSARAKVQILHQGKRTPLRDASARNQCTCYGPG
jgi:hypothetical protein